MQRNNEQPNWGMGCGAQRRLRLGMGAGLLRRERGLCTATGGQTGAPGLGAGKNRRQGQRLFCSFAGGENRAWTFARPDATGIWSAIDRLQRQIDRLCKALQK